MQVNMNSITISVVIPAYNVERYIEKAVKSALAQIEVTEIVVVDDGSDDLTQEIVERLARTNDNVKFHQHKDGVNRGRAATRNLGIEMSTSTHIAFLDADDFYLNNRFKKDLEVLKDMKVDGCYSAVGFHFYREPKVEEQHHYKISTLSKTVAHDLLFENIVTTKLGYLHLNGLTIKKSVFDIVGLMNTNLPVAEDTDIIFKLALKCRIATASIERLVAARGIHDSNVFHQDELYKKYIPLLFESLIKWSFKNNIKRDRIELLINALWIHKFRESNSLIKDSFYAMQLNFKIPHLCLTIFSIKYFPLVRKRKTMFKKV